MRRKISERKVEKKTKHIQKRKLKKTPSDTNWKTMIKCTHRHMHACACTPST